MKIQTDPRHNARKIALSILFSSLFDETNKEDSLDVSKEILEVPETDDELTNRILKGTEKYLDEIDGVIQKCAPEWPIDKISKIDLVILRMSVYEILHDNSVPDKVVIDEAVELAKEFGNDTSGKFVNGVLGTVVEIKNSILADEAKEKNEQVTSQETDTASN